MSTSLFNFLKHQPNFFKQFRLAAKALLLGTGTSFFVLNGNAQAVETIQLKYYGSDPTVPGEVTLSLDEIQTFVQTGELRQQVRDFFNINRQDPRPLQEVLTEQIRVPSNLEADFVDSSVGRFVVTQLEKFVQSSDTAQNLQASLRESIQDDRNLSLLELIENFPTQSVTLDITELVQTYNNVSSFVDRVLPALEVAREYLQDLICECEQPAAGTPQSNLSNGTLQATACAVPKTATAPATHSATSQGLAQVQPVSTP